MRLLITGGNGLVGKTAAHLFRSRFEVVCPAEEELDVTNREKISSIITREKPRIVLHCAAFTDVDGCEREPEKAYLINSESTRNVAVACRESGAILVYFSTDFVFDGRSHTPYSETDQPNPLSVYGKSKLAGEHQAQIAERFLIVRTSKIFGPAGRSFASRLPEIMKKQKKVFLDTNAVNSPTFVCDLVYAVQFLLEKGILGLVNVCNRGGCSWLEFGQEIKRLLDLQAVELVPVRYEYRAGERAERPAFSVLSTQLLESHGFQMPTWQDALRLWPGVRS